MPVTSWEFEKLNRSFQHKARLLRGILAVLLPLMLPGLAAAEKYFIEPTFNLRTGYDDNINLSTNDEDDSFSAILNAKTRFGFRTERSDVGFGVRLNFARYTENDLDKADQYFDMDAKHRLGLNLFRLQGNYDRASTRTTELDTTGRIRKNKRVIKTGLHPSWSRTLNERTTLQLGYAYNNTDYRVNDDSGLFDYSYKVADASLTYQLSERDSVFTSVDTSKYDSSDAGTEFRSYRVRIGASHLFSETLSGSLSVGGIYTKSDFRIRNGPDGDTDDTGFLLDASLKKRFERTTADLSLGTSEVPTGNGLLMRRQDMRLNLRHDFNERTVFSLNSAVYRTEKTGGINFDKEDRVFFSLWPKVSWRATPWWTISGEYRYRYQKYDNQSNGYADSNAVFLSVNYVWPRESLSRWMDL